MIVPFVWLLLEVRMHWLASGEVQVPSLCRSRVYPFSSWSEVMSVLSVVMVGTMCRPEEET
jgi:hypothetical protein